MSTHRYKVQRQDTDLKLKKVYFFWICPDFGAFEWFQEMLAQVENDLLGIGKTDFLEYHIYLSRGWDANQVSGLSAIYFYNSHYFGTKIYVIYRQPNKIIA